MSSALAISPDQTEWTIPQLQALELEQASVADLLRFLHVCQQTGLDPFARQILMIGRNDNRRGTVVHRPVTTIDGFRIVAQRSQQYEGQVDAEWCGPDGQWVEVWLDPSKPPAAARIGVWRSGFRQPLRAVALWKEYGGTGGMWRTMPALMLGKVAEALALRKAFPQDLSGLYIGEEMDQADSGHRAAENPVAAPEKPQAPQVTVDEILGQVSQADTRDKLAGIWRVASQAGLLDALIGDETGQKLGEFIAEQGTILKAKLVLDAQVVAEEEQPPTQEALDDAAAVERDKEWQAGGTATQPQKEQRLVDGV